MDLFATVSESDPSYLCDVRTPGDFKTATFSQYKKTDVKTALLESLRNGKVENSCYWCAEMIAAGQFIDVWDILFLVLSKYIHHGNPMMVQYYRRRFALFRTVVNEHNRVSCDSPLALRNNVIIRQLFAEMAATVALAEKSPSYEEITIASSDDMMTQMMHQLQADRADYASHVIRENDPKELHIAINELSYHLQVTRHMSRACYWIEWIIAFTALCKKKGEPLFCEPRTEYDELDKRYQKDTTWLVWETIIGSCNMIHQHKQKKDQQTTITSLFELFRIRYAGAATVKKRKHMLYFGVSLLTETVTYTSELVSDKHKDIIRVATDHIYDIYSTLRIHAQQQQQQQQQHDRDSQSQENYRAIEKKENHDDSMKKWDILTKLDTIRQI